MNNYPLKRICFSELFFPDFKSSKQQSLVNQRF